MRYGILVSKERNQEDKKEFVLRIQSVLERYHAVERPIRRSSAWRGHSGFVSSQQVLAQLAAKKAEEAGQSSPAGESVWGADAGSRQGSASVILFLNFHPHSIEEAAKRQLLNQKTKLASTVHQFIMVQIPPTEVNAAPDGFFNLTLSILPRHFQVEHNFLRRSKFVKVECEVMLLISILLLCCYCARFRLAFLVFQTLDRVGIHPGLLLCCCCASSQRINLLPCCCSTRLRLTSSFCRNLIVPECVAVSFSAAAARSVIFVSSVWSSCSCLLSCLVLFLRRLVPVGELRRLPSDPPSAV